MMEYKGYRGTTTFDDEAEIFHGEVIGTRDVITFQGESVQELKQAFEDSVDEYLAFCRERGKKPDKTFSGKFMVRVDPDDHRKAALAARVSGLSLNAWIVHVIQQEAEKELRP